MADYNAYEVDYGTEDADSDENNVFETCYVEKKWKNKVLGAKFEYINNVMKGKYPNLDFEIKKVSKRSKRIPINISGPKRDVDDAIDEIQQRLAPHSKQNVKGKKNNNQNNARNQHKKQLNTNNNNDDEKKQEMKKDAQNTENTENAQKQEQISTLQNKLKQLEPIETALKNNRVFIVEDIYNNQQELKQIVNAEQSEMREERQKTIQSVENILNKHETAVDKLAKGANLLNTINQACSQNKIHDFAQQNNNNDDDDEDMAADEGPGQNDDEKDENAATVQSEVLFNSFVYCKGVIDEQHVNLEQLPNHIVKLFSQSSAINHELKVSKSKIEKMRENYQETENKYNKIQKERIEIETQMKALFIKCNELIIRENELFKDKIKKNLIMNDSQSNDFKQYQNMLEKSKKIIAECKSIQTTNLQNIPRVNQYLEQQWTEFEKKWHSWNTKDILTWIRYKLKWLDTKSIPTGVDLEKIQSEMEKNKLSGMSLNRIDKTDLREFGFEVFDIRASVYDNILYLRDTYPIPTKNDGNESDPDIEGGVQVTEGADNIPSRFKCPITKEIMKEPVIAFDGVTYEKSAIVQYIKMNKKSPSTGQDCNEDDIENVFVNYHLLQEINKYNAKNN